jgi:23S rRNA (adenine2503-C2)-methyltransferase
MANDSSAADLTALEQESTALSAPLAARVSLLGVPKESLAAFLAEHDGGRAFRIKQVHSWVFRARVTSFDAMTNVSAALRAKLAAHYTLDRPCIDEVHASNDGTRKYRFVASDNTAFEAVYIPEVAKGRGTNTLCISSQSGCAVGCKFCFTASLKRNRNLTTAEIVGQVLAVMDDLVPLGEGAQVTNIVFMGMGEPLLNYTHVVTAAQYLVSEEACGFSPRRVTISTSGIVPRLVTLGHDVPTQLAISLNATTDAIRTRIMPINKKWPIEELIEAMRNYPLLPRRRITVEYVLLGGINDSMQDAHRLNTLLDGIPVKINLLPLNAHDRTEFIPPTHAQVMAFQRVLLHAGHNVFVRTPRGQDIAAACGQLGESITPQLPPMRRQADLDALSA